MTECSNPGREDHWTCPECYADMPGKTQGPQTCERCGAEVLCTVIQQPVCRSTTDSDEIQDWKDLHERVAS